MLSYGNILFRIIISIVVGLNFGQKIGLLSKNSSLLSNLNGFSSNVSMFYVNSTDLFELKQIVCLENFQGLIFDSLHQKSEAKLLMLTKFFQIPIFWIRSTWQWDPSVVNDNSIIFQHSFSDIAQIVEQVIRNYTVSNSLLIADDSSNLFFSLLLSRLKSERVKLLFKTTLEENNCSSLIRSILIEFKWKLQFIVLINPSSIQTILKNVVTCGFIQPGVNWIILNSCLENFDLNFPELSSVKFISFYYKNEAQIIDSGCPIKRGENLIKNTIRKLLNWRGASSPDNSTRNQCDKRSNSYNSSFLEDNQEIRNIFDLDKNGFLKVDTIQVMQFKPSNNSVGFFIPSNLSYETRVYKDISVNICIRRAPTLFTNVSQNNSIDFLLLILNHFHENFNFKWIITEPENGSNSECLNKVLKNQIDVMVDFTSVIDTVHMPLLLWTLLEEEHCFILGTDLEDNGVTMWAPVQFFNLTFLLLLGACLLFYSLMALLYSRFSNIVPTVNSTWPAITSDTTFLDLCWNFCGAFLMQGLEYNPLNGSLSTLSFFWWVYAIIISSVYSGSLTVTMTVSNNKYLYLSNSIFELLQTEKVDVYIVRDSYIDVWLNNSTETVYTLLKSRRIYVSTLEECFQKVLDHINSKKSNLVACLSPCINTMRPEETCRKSRVMTNTLFPIQISMVFSPQTPSREFIISQLNELKVSGKLEHFRHNSTANVFCLPQNNNDQYSGEPIGKEGLIGVIFIIYALFLLGLISLGVELLYMKIKHRKQLSEDVKT